MPVTRVQYNLAKQAAGLLEKSKKEIPDELRKRIEEGNVLFSTPITTSPRTKSRSAAAMYLLGASLRQISLLMGIRRETAYRYAFNELKHEMPKRRTGEKGMRNAPMLSEEIVSVFWQRLAYAPDMNSAQELAEWITKHE